MSVDTVEPSVLAVLDQRPVDIELDEPIEQNTNDMVKIQVPPEIKVILKDMIRAVLKDQPREEDILLFLAQYLNTMARIRDTTGQNPFEVHDEIDEFDEGDVAQVHFAESDEL